MNFKATAVKAIIYTLLLISFYILYMVDVLDQYKSFFLQAFNLTNTTKNFFDLIKPKLSQFL